jgi:hypothetical protein
MVPGHLPVPDRWHFSVPDRRDEITLDLIRRAAARPDFYPNRIQRPSLLDPPDVAHIHAFSFQLYQAAFTRLNRGNLPGSWDDIKALFRMARHFSKGSGVEVAEAAVSVVERDALGAAIEWALAPGQTPERLHTALEAYRSLPKMAPPSDVVRAQANLFENTLDLPSDSLRRYLEELVYGPKPAGKSDRRRLVTIGMIDVVTTPWELAHARRVNRLASSAALEAAEREPGRRLEHYAQSPTLSSALTLLPDPLSRILRPVDNYLFADEQNEVARRALVQILAIRSWQLKHNGQFPESLDALVPDELPSLPNDPYSNRPFGYLPSSGRNVVTLQAALRATSVISASELIKPQPGSMLLYSVGHDRHDDGGLADTTSFPGRDIVFAIPPIAAKPGAENTKADGKPNSLTEAAKPK